MSDKKEPVETGLKNDPPKKEPFETEIKKEPKGPLETGLPKEPSEKEPSKTAVIKKDNNHPYGDGPTFIYGGPFIKKSKPSIFLDLETPPNIQLSGTYRNNYAYRSLKEKLPRILEKVKQAGKGDFVRFIDRLKNDLMEDNRLQKFKGDDEEAEKWNEWMNGLISKNYFGNPWVWTECYVYRRIIEGLELNNIEDFDPFEGIKSQAFTGNVEPMCVVAEKMLEYTEKTDDRATLKEEWINLLKVSLWANSCDSSMSAGEKADMKDVCPLPVLPFPKPGSKPKALKKGKLPPVAPPLTNLGYIDPFQISLDLKSNLLADDSGKSFEQLMSRSNKIRTNIQKVIEKNDKKFKQKCSCHRLAELAGVPLKLAPGQNMPQHHSKHALHGSKHALHGSKHGLHASKHALHSKQNLHASQHALEYSHGHLPEPPPGGYGPSTLRLTDYDHNKLGTIPEQHLGATLSASDAKKAKGKKGGVTLEPELPKIPCPAKMTVPQCVFLDIVCDNAGYELFADLCIAHWAISQGIVDKVRFHVKKYPWFVSDVTEKDFHNVINQCKIAHFSKDVVKPPPPEPDETRSIRSDALNQIANEWQKYIDEGKFLLMDEDYWTYPLTYNQMKKEDPDMYRKLQYAAMILFKGDLNYRKLLGERNAVPATALEPNLQGFLPAPLVALRTIKSELICGLPKGRYEQLKAFDPHWMEKGTFGVIQMCKKVEPIPKLPNQPCVDYGITCFGQLCPEHHDI